MVYVVFIAVVMIMQMYDTREENMKSALRHSPRFTRKHLRTLNILFKCLGR